MAHDGKILARAREQLAKIREQNRAEQRRREDEIARRIPEMERTQALLVGQMKEILSLTLSHEPGTAEKLKALEKANLDLLAYRAELLTAHGYPLDYLDDIYSCPNCHDSGILRGEVCHCLEKIYKNELTNELGRLMRSGGGDSFREFDLSYYSASYDARFKAVPREAMRKVLSACKKFADNFPDVSSNLLLQGDTGLGKTLLSSCIARQVADKDYSVFYDSVSSALEAFERQKFSRTASEQDDSSAQVQRMLSCDLLILDDLGTEMINSASMSFLYSLINRRISNSKRMIISTNLSDEQIRKLYSPQIASRLLGEFLRLPFVGDDIRLLKK